MQPPPPPWHSLQELIFDPSAFKATTVRVSGTVVMLDGTLGRLDLADRGAKLIVRVDPARLAGSSLDLHGRAEVVGIVKKEQRRTFLDASEVRPLAAAADEASGSDSSEEEADEVTREVWRRVEVVLREHCLSALAMAASRKWVREMADPSNDTLARLRSWMLLRINGRERPVSPPSPWQSGCPELLTGLRARPVWETAELPWLRPLEERAGEIRAELLALRSCRGFQPLKIPDWASSSKVASPDGAGSLSHDAGEWNVFYLSLHELPFADNRARCPVTVSLLAALPRPYDHAFFSALTPGTHVVKHHGPTNKKLRVHLPLVGVEGSRLRVADRTYECVEGRCFAFDDSFEHEAWHDGDRTRIVLVFDVWHPDLHDREVQFLSLLQRSRLRAEMKRAEAAAERAARGCAVANASLVAREGGGREEESAPLARGDNFFQLLRDAKNALPDNEWWV